MIGSRAVASSSSQAAETIAQWNMMSSSAAVSSLSWSNVGCLALVIFLQTYLSNAANNSAVDVFKSSSVNKIYPIFRVRSVVINILFGHLVQA